jgi:hypothetical protein
MAADWSLAEAEAIASDYFSMLERELRSEAYSKTEHRRRLKERLPGRTDGSIERKHQNISAILIESGFPYVVEPPIPAEKNLARSPAAHYAVRPRIGVDYLALEARNGALGRAGEELVMAYEVARLRHLRKPKLADRVEPVPRTRGDGLGYDIQSFETSGEDRFIEVKTTGFGKDTPFYVTRAELRFSVESAAQFHLYRLFQFRKEPKMFSLNGALDKTCVLDASQFIARVG